ncbi:prephenate dehydratase PHA2 [Saccharomyces eubayanus]|uniref:prephenate dehydratase PHA2 n=1 Tax=Saccharomyces eubayanus TaxID=1080349 RepID=UPI0006C49E9E|nr:PHA2-like protein [Saccharomyces eubayanus]KOG96865.1 PHA2-like protein [Saccharomyces eubayanus]
MNGKNLKVIFLGPKGTYSHQAALQQFQSIPNVDYLPTASIPQCFDKLERNASIDYSVVPLENSTNGQVVFSYDLLRDRMIQKVLSSTTSAENNRITPDIEVIAEQYVSITHCLISPIELSNGIESFGKFQEVKIYSHPQVWGQVDSYLKSLAEKFPQVTFSRSDCSSTSESVNQCMQSQIDNHDNILHVAIASETAARLYKAQVIEHSINDKLGNTTRFLVLRRRRDTRLNEVGDTKLPQVNLLTFTTRQDDPGSLVDVLNVLKIHSLNMCSINSRPFNLSDGDRNWRYLFFIEYYTDKNAPNHNEQFYKDIGGKCKHWCLWGTFPRSEMYYYK